MVSFGDIHKRQEDVFKGYPDDQIKVEVDTKTTDGVSFKPSLSLNNGKPTGKLNYGFSDSKCPFGLTSAIDTSGKLSGTADFGEVFGTGIHAKVNGEFNVSQQKGESVSTNLKYSADNFSTDAKVNYGAGAFTAKTSAVVGFEGINVGAEVDIDLKSNSLSGYSGAVSYTSNSFMITGALKDKGSKFVAGYVHSVCKDLDVGAEYVHELSKDSAASKSFKIGLKRALDSDSTVRAKINTAGEVSVAYDLKLQKDLKVSLGSRFTNVFDSKATEAKLGLGLLFKA